MFDKVGISTNKVITSKSDASVGDYVILIGAVSGRTGAQVTATNIDADSDQPIDNTTVVNYDTSSGDSGGPVSFPEIISPLN